uniref:Bromodomain PHD finger transcription factor n=1 Tax=Varanus komodoensis TaxID=61221 RepID=A0A8D2JFA9_VARKO
MRGRRGRPPKHQQPAAAPARASTPAPPAPPGPIGGLRSRLRGSSRGRWAASAQAAGAVGPRPRGVGAAQASSSSSISSTPRGGGRRKGGGGSSSSTPGGGGSSGRGRGRAGVAAAAAAATVGGGGGGSRSSSGSQGRAAAAASSRRSSSKVVYDDHESEEEEEDESVVSDEDEEGDPEEKQDSEEEEAVMEEEEDDDDSDYPEEMEDEDDASYCTESSFRSHSTYSSTPGRRRQRVHRPRSPILEEKDIPSLELPKSSEDLMVPSEHIMNVIAIYEVLRNFGTVLRLSPFRFEDFCAALVSQEQCTLMAEMHIVLLKAVLREEDTSNTTFGPADLKDSVNSTLYFIDGMTWPEVLRVYCESDKEYHHVLPFQEAEDYPYGPVENKIKVLQFLVDQFLTTNIAREELMSEGVIQYDDHCRVCHKLGDLLCCETCSAVYHLECVKPPLEEVPEDEWQCEVCVAHKVPGVTDCIAEIQKNKPYIRHEPIGYDRNRRKYWFLNRRIVVEEDSECEKDKKIWYYSTKVQLAELIECLDKDYWEADLCKTLEEMREEIHRHMDITEDLTNKARGSNKAFLGAANEEILELIRARKGETLEDKSSIDDDTEKEKTGVENKDSAGTDNDKEELSNQQLDVSKEMPPDESSEKGRKEGKQDALAQLIQSESPSTGRGTPCSTRMVTRLRNPDSKLSQLKSQQVAAAAHEANKLFKEGKEVLVVNSQGEVSRLNTKKEIVMKGNINNYFKLGQEGKYRVYHNQYATNSFALNKHQHREDHDKRRHLSHKFCLSPAGEFKWNGSVHGSKVLTISTLRLTIIQLENNIPSSFLHPNWASHRSNWIKAVQMCSKPREFALALAILECAIKPVVMLPIWRESLGHTRLRRMTAIEREEKEKVKKKERKQEEEETMQQATWVKYTFPIKHQVWKQKGEEYRVTGYGGWIWISKTHVHRFVPRLPGNTNVSYRKLLPGKFWKSLFEIEFNHRELDKRKNPAKVKTEHGSLKDRIKNFREPYKKDQKESENEKEIGENDKDIKEEPMEIDEVKIDTSTKSEIPINADLINVSEGFHLRTCYKRKVKTSKLDGLLERRVKQFTLEEKQRLERIKLKASANSSGCKSPSPEKNLDDLQIAKTEDGKQVDITSQNRIHISGTNQTEDPVKDHLSSSSLHFTKSSESVQSLPCLNRLLEGEGDLSSVQCPDTQTLLGKDTNESVSEQMDMDKNQIQSKESEMDSSVTEDSKPVEDKEASECDILEGSAKCSEQASITESQCENVIQPMVTESGYARDASSSTRQEREELKSEKQDSDSAETCSLDDHSEVLPMQANEVKECSLKNSEDAAEPTVAVNPKQAIGGLTSLHTELISEKAFEAQILDNIGENIDEVVKSKITEANGEKEDQEKCVSPSSINKCFDQIKSIADKNNKNGELDTQTEREKTTAFQINGKDPDFKVLPNEECLKRETLAQTESNIDSKVNNVNKNNPLVKPFSSNEPVKPFMNGDIAVEDTNERKKLDVEGSADTDGDSRENDLPCSPERASPVDDTSIPPIHSCNENSIYSETECMEIESPCVKKSAPSPVISCEESSLSNDFADQNGLQMHNKLESINGENAVKAVVTEVTTTSTISTESKTIYKISELSAIKDDKESVVSSTENCSISTVTTTMTTTVTKLSTPTSDSNPDIISVKEHSKTVVTTTVTDSLTTPGGTLVTSMTVSKEYSTRDKVKLMKFSRPKKTRSGTALPSYRKFITKSSKKSIFVLPNDDLKKLARKGGIREVPCFNYTAKPALDIWPYPSPRPTFGITWRYRLQTVKSLAGVSLMLRLLWACLKWDDMAAKPPPGGGTTRTETSETEITTTEIIKRRDVGPYGIRSEYCIRKIICPIGVPEAPKETPTPQRKGLRSSALRPKRPETPKQTGPVIIETWVAEEELELWEIKAFSERVEKEKAQAVEQQAKKRLEQQKQLPAVCGATTATTTSSTATTVSTPQKVVVGPLPRSMPTGAKVVLATKVGSPATVTFQQNKNFHQTFATWVKQGQPSTATTTTATSATTISSSGQTFQIASSPVTMAGKVITKLPLPANSKIVAVNVPATQGGVVQVQQKVLGIIPSTTGANQQTFTSFQPRTATVTIRPNNTGAVCTTSASQVMPGTPLRPGMTVIRTPLQQSALGKTIIRTPVVVQQGQPQQVVTQIIRGQPVSTAVSSATTVSTSQKIPSTPGTSSQHMPPQATPPHPPRPQQGQVKLTMAQLTQLTQGQGGSQGLTVVIQGQGQTTGQLQLIPQGVTVIPGPGQQLMQAAMPNGTIQRFLFTPLPTAATATSTTTTTVSTSTSAQTQTQPVPALPPTEPQPLQSQLPTQPHGQPQSSQPQAQTPAQPQLQPQPPPPPPQPPQSLLQAETQAPPESQPPTQAAVPSQAPSKAQTVQPAPLQSTTPQPVQAQPHPPLHIQTQQPQVPTSVQTLPTVSQVTVQSPRPPLQIQPPQTKVITVPQLQQQVQVFSQLQSHVVAQIQAQQGGLPQQIKLQLPIQIQQAGPVQTHQIQNVVTVQAASVQEQLQRVQQLREQQQKKKQHIEIKREHSLQASNQSDIIQKQVVMKHNAVIEHLKQKKTLTPAEREENQRMIVCNQVMKYILDKIDKEEKQAAKKRKREESVEQKRSKQNATKLSALLFKHKEQLKAEILKKRALLDKDLQIEVQVKILSLVHFYGPKLPTVHILFLCPPPSVCVCGGGGDIIWKFYKLCLHPKDFKALCMQIKCSVKKGSKFKPYAFFNA